MKKMKKALLWSIVSILGASGAVAGAIVGTSTNLTTVENSIATNDSISGNNSTSANSTDTSSSDKTTDSGSYNNTNNSSNTSTTANAALKIVYLNKYVETFSETPANVSILATGSGYINYKWYVNKNDGNGWKLKSSSSLGSYQVDAPSTNEVLTWTFRCEVTDMSTKEKITSDEVQFTILPSDGRYISVTTQPSSLTSAKGGDVVTLSTTAAQSGSLHKGESIGYQWFKYNSTFGKYEEISGANSEKYIFVADYSDTTTTTKYLCKYYFISKSSNVVYLSESHVATVTIEATKKPEEQIKITSLLASSYSIKSEEKTTLSVTASSNLTSSLSYQWYKANNSGEFEAITGATNSTYEYTAEKISSTTEVIFMVMVKGEDYYLQSDNLTITVSPVAESTKEEIPTNELTVTSSIYQNQAPVNDKFESWSPITRAWYVVNVTNATNDDLVTYQWYYAGSDGVEHLIEGATNSSLTPTTSLFKSIYENNSSHRAQIICKVYYNRTLSNIVDQNSNYKFYMTVGIVTRK